MANRKTSKTSRRASRLSEGTTAHPLDYGLVYPGKHPVADILNGPRADPALRLSVTKQAEEPWRNRLYCADNLGVLRTLLADSHVRSKVKLVYIDPPFATGGIFESRNGQRAYDDLAY